VPEPKRISEIEAKLSYMPLDEQPEPVAMLILDLRYCIALIRQLEVRLISKRPDCLTPLDLLESNNEATD